MFVGGEPTVHPHITDIVSMLHETLGERLNHISIITNGSRNSTLYKKIAEIAKSISFEVSVSIHTDHVEMTHILELIENLSSLVTLKFELMFNPDKREMVHEIYDTLCEYRKKFRFRLEIPLIRDGDRVDPRYVPEDFEWQKKATTQFNDLVKSVVSNLPIPKIRRHNFYVIRDIEENGTIKTGMMENRNLELAKGLLNFKGMYCIAHAAVLRIEEDGRCRGMICGDDKIICNVFEENSLWPVRDKLIHAVKCTHNICGCGANDIIPKFASAEAAKKYVEFAQRRQAQLFGECDLIPKKQSPPPVEHDLVQKKQATPPAEHDLAQKKQATLPIEHDLVQKKQVTPPTKHEDYDPNSYEVYIKSIANPLSDIPLDSFRNSFPVVI